MKLKTLKEIFSSNKNELFINREYLKAEAIKWVKYCEYRGNSGCLCIPNHRCRGCQRTMKMNNITEEELK